MPGSVRHATLKAGNVRHATVATGRVSAAGTRAGITVHPRVVAGQVRHSA